MTATAPSPTIITWKNFKTGLSDWTLEKLSASKRNSATPEKKKSTKLLKWGLLLGLIALAPFLAAVLAPPVASAMTIAGPSAIASLFIALMIGLGLLLVIGVPVWLGFKFLKGCEALCQRGYDINEGVRARTVFIKHGA